MYWVCYVVLEKNGGNQLDRMKNEWGGVKNSASKEKLLEESTAYNREETILDTWYITTVFLKALLERRSKEREPEKDGDEVI